MKGTLTFSSLSETRNGEGKDSPPFPSFFPAFPPFWCNSWMALPCSSLSACSRAWVAGCVAKTKGEHKDQSFAIFLLCLDGHSEEFCDEPCLPQTISSIYPLHLSFPKHV